MSGSAMRLTGFSLPLTEVFSLVVIGLVLVAILAAVVVSLAEERRKARRVTQDTRPPCCESPSVI
jgi:hypothetical protein